MSLRRVLAVLLSATAVALSGCGGEDVDRVVSDAERKVEDVRERGRDVQRDVEREKDRLVRRIRKILEDIEKSVPTAPPTARPPSTDGQTSPTEIDQFLTEVIQDVDEYWTRTLTGADLPAPRVSYIFVPPGERAVSGCQGAPADDFAAFYCPADDTIYIGLSFAARLYTGLTEGLPGDSEREGDVGDFGVAYIVAHEYAHNVQTELGFYQLDPGQGARPFELQADCMAGLWGNSVFRRGLLKPGDVEEALNTALAVGDFDFGNEQHHGTPRERREAWLRGYETGEPAVCRRYVPGT